MVLRLFLIDVALALVALLIMLGWGVSVQALGALYLTTVLITNLVLLQRDRSSAPKSAEKSQSRHTGYLYITSAVYLAGFVYGSVMILMGELPRATVPGLLIPLLMCVHSFRVARRPKRVPSE
jgi:hypothetical protein